MRAARQKGAHAIGDDHKRGWVISGIYAEGATQGRPLDPVAREGTVG